MSPNPIGGPGDLGKHHGRRKKAPRCNIQGPPPETVEAGVQELREMTFGMDLAEIIMDVFYAMNSAANLRSYLLPRLSNELRSIGDASFCNANWAWIVQ